MLTKKDKRSATVALAVGAALLFFYFRISDASYRAAVMKLKDNLALAQQELESWGLESNLPALNSAFSARTDASKLIDKIQDIARQSRVRLTSIEPRAPVKQDLYEYTSIKLVSICSYNAFGNFISRLEGSKEFIRIDKLRIEPLAGLSSSDDREAGEPAFTNAPDRETEARAELVISIVYLN